METEAAAQESLGLGKLGTQAEKDRRLKKKQVWRFFPPFSNFYLLFIIVCGELKREQLETKQQTEAILSWCSREHSVLEFPGSNGLQLEMTI